MADCRLRCANGVDGAPCDEGACTYWRVLEHLDRGAVPAPTGCAIQHFGLLDGGDHELAAWLLSVKERVESLAH